jgi:hypothetical protein
MLREAEASRLCLLAFRVADREGPEAVIFGVKVAFQASVPDASPKADILAHGSNRFDPGHIHS